METHDALILKKSSYGEADLLVTLFSRESGKFRALAKNAKKSRKRFGGRFDFFNRLAIEVTLNKGRFNLVGDVILKRSYREITESLDSFTCAVGVLQLADFLIPEDEPATEFYDLTTATMELLSKKHEPRPLFLLFLLRAIGFCGYAPDLPLDEEKDFVWFDIESGKIDSFSQARGRRNVHGFHLDIMKQPEVMNAHPEKVRDNIRTLTKYIEYRTGKRLGKTGFPNEIEI